VTADFLEILCALLFLFFAGLNHWNASIDSILRALNNLMGILVGGLQHALNNLGLFGAFT
jgi:hypothetical protein